MEKEYYLINEAAKEVHVESHVLRYWETELGFVIKRNAKGHRLYSKEDVDRLIRVKTLKDEGLQLKAVKKVLQQEVQQEKESYKVLDKDPKVINFHIKPEEGSTDEKDTVSKIVADVNKQKDDIPNLAIEIKAINDLNEKNVDQEIVNQEIVYSANTETLQEEKARKALRIQTLFQNMISDAVMTSQEQILHSVKENIAKEFDFQFRQLEELAEEREIKQIQREEKREKEKKEREEAHYKEIDMLLRKTNIKTKRKKLS